MMHEQVVAQNIIQEAKKHGSVKSIVVEVGDLAHLPAKEMREVLERLTDWEINVVSMKALVLCNDCKHLGLPEIMQQMHDHCVFKCMKCGKMFPEVEEGDKIMLKEVEIE